MTIAPATELDAVFGGVDSHADTIHVAVITGRGGHVADAEFPTTSAGYAAAVAFLNAHGTVTAVGVEGTSSYGPGFTRAARHTGLTVVEVNRPDKAERRRIGQVRPHRRLRSRPGRAVRRASVIPKDDTISGIRALHKAARSAVKARTDRPRTSPSPPSQNTSASGLR
ncbi:IS110 family transposase [Streptomyces microflavus]